MKEDKFFGILYDIFVEEGIFEYEDKTENLNEKATRIKEFLERAERIDKLAISSKNFMAVVIEDCKNRYVIKEENIPLSYFKKLEEEYFENGSGPLDLTNPKSDGEQKTREKNVDRIIRNQQISLEKMIKQLYSEEIEKLPIWAKLIIFYSALKLGSFNCAKKEFSPRNADSIEPFIEIDMEMLQQCILFAKTALDIEDLEEEKLKEILSPKTMSKLYSNLVGQQKSKLFSNSSTENGPKQLVRSDIQWYCYRRYSLEYTPNDKPLYQRLYDSLQGHNTGWDIAIDIEKTKEKLKIPLYI